MQKIFLLLTLICLAANGGHAQTRNIEMATERPGTIPCCREEIKAIKAASKNPDIEKSDIKAFVDISPTGKHVKTAGSFGCFKREDGSYDNCDLYITEKLKVNLTGAELDAILAHEIGHLIDQVPEVKLEHEYKADDFALAALQKLGLDRRVLVSALKKLLIGEIFESEKDMTQIRARIERVESLLAAEKVIPR